MYIFFSIFLVVAMICLVLFHFRKKKIICKICNLCACQKCEILNDAIEPFGFQYDLSQDIFTSRVDAMQRKFGYTSLYDNAAAIFNMVFHCEPVYFDYEGKTWLIEFWKGQYGINIGAEIGVYHADRIVRPSDRAKTLFFGVEDDNLFPMALQLFQNDKPLYFINEEHWWLTGFSMGKFAYPEPLSLKLSIMFPTHSMLVAFTDALMKMGYTEDDFYTTEFTVYLRFDKPRSNCPCRKHRFSAWLSQLQNRIFCKLYLKLTKPFCHTMDRLLLLYFAIPFAFRRMCKPRVYRKGRLRR